MKINNKILTFVFLFVLLLSVSSCVFAAETVEIISNTANNSGTVYTVDDFSSIVAANSSNYILSFSSGRYRLCFLPSGCKFYNPGGGADFYAVDSDGNTVDIVTYRTGFGTTVWESEPVIENHVPGGDHEQIYWAADIYNTDGTVFFQAPLVVEEKEKTILTKTVETIPLAEVLQEIIQILPLIIAVVVSLVGLRKALTMLLALLNQS